MSDSRSRADSKLDEALEESFPASDPVESTVETGIRVGELPATPAESITDNQSRHRFELTVSGEVAFLVYERTPVALTLVHTEVPPALRGRHVGEALVRFALESARSKGLQIVAVCPFVKAYLRRHPPSQGR